MQIVETMDSRQTSVLKRLSAMGQVSDPDRVQRLFFSVCLMTLTIWGMTEQADWKHIVALTLQVELLLTALIGWCPIYCTCRALTMKDDPK